MLSFITFWFTNLPENGMLIEILKLLVPLIGGGLAGAALNEFIRRRNARVQSIPIIERVNRLVSPQLKGFALARIVGQDKNRALEEINNVREYQLTLRNTSTVHLQEVEIQFEFPTTNVDAWSSRPALSKTAPIYVEPTIAEPWKKGFRWRIPHLPSDDSIEFSFTAIDPPTDEYEVALYKSDKVILKKSKGEPTEKRRNNLIFATSQLVVVVLASLVGIGGIYLNRFTQGSVRGFIQESGCTLTLDSSYRQFDSVQLPWSGPWQISYVLTNVGQQNCVVQMDEIGGNALTLSAGGEIKRSLFSQDRPEKKPRPLSFGSDTPSQKKDISIYAPTN